MSCAVYWIHHPEHTDMFTQGYIGISNNIKKRFECHKNRPSNIHLKNAIKKYGWDNLIKQVLIIADESYCLAMEIKLRAKKQIGWNLVEGGGKPPLTKWNLGKNLSEETKAKISAKKIGTKHTPETQAKINLNLTEGGKATRFVKGTAPWNKGVALGVEATKHLHGDVTCPHCNKIGMLSIMHRWHMDNCKDKDKGELF